MTNYTALLATQFSSCESWVGVTLDGSAAGLSITNASCANASSHRCVGTCDPDAQDGVSSMQAVRRSRLPLPPLQSPSPIPGLDWAQATSAVWAPSLGMSLQHFARDDDWSSLVEGRTAVSMECFRERMKPWWGRLLLAIVWCQWASGSGADFVGCY